MYNKSLVAVLLLIFCSFQFSCREGYKIEEGTKSLEGYYKIEKKVTNGSVLISMELRKDSSAIYLTDYNDDKPEIILKGKWSVNKEDSTVVDIMFNDELMRFEKKGSVLDLMTNHNFGKVGLTELMLLRAAKPDDTKLLVMWVAPETGFCDNKAEKKCLRVRWGNEDRGNYFVFQDSIINFKYQEGSNYKLKVERRKKSGLPPDSTAYEFILKEQLLKR